MHVGTNGFDILAAGSMVRWSRTRGVVRMRSSCSCPDGRCGVGITVAREPQTTLRGGQFPAAPNNFDVFDILYQWYCELGAAVIQARQ
jgi:hypothetical protein